ncbi:hydrolase [Microbacterium sp. SZ1]|uniref:HAD family hydrolase n=1 Tax=Microbacterium sp. SZ1 TaxID=1849736 RepID=UPI000BBBE322|nr:HAD family hydrolase [Microbacterium sp. SZ1]PCE14585.1 hydrolase [Microbacterium sp. SZ1]
MNSILLFDFDGTIALGDGPVLAYARQVADGLGERGDGLVDGIRSALAAAEAGALDGYDAVRRAALERGADAALLSSAYRASREQLATAHAPITVPEGLAELLAAAEGRAERLLVTNAPAIRLDEALDALGLTGLFDRIVTSARKPAGLEALLAELPSDIRVLSVGDIWHNDLAPAHARGHATALLGGFPDPAATPTFRASDFASLVPGIETWLHAEAPAPVPSAHRTSTTSTHIEG